ncbi:MAG: hypothetical protein VKI42_09915 [Synechococcaceae cyanobacterium]|nr:hypothetical protein [Synechococcaceae cyanobacterium]
MKLCRTLADSSQTLQGNANIALGLGPLPLLSGRQECLESPRTTVFSVSLVVTVRRVWEGLMVWEPRLRGDVAQRLATEGVDRFVAEHGDCGVGSVQLGGEMQGDYTLDAPSREEADQVERRIGLSFPLEGLTLTPEFGSRLRRIQQDNSVNSSWRVQMLGLSQPPSVANAEALVALASDIAGLTHHAPVVLSVQTRGDEELPELMALFGPLRANRALLPGNDSDPGLLRRKQRLLEIANQCRWLEDTCHLDGQTPETSLQDQRTQVRTDVAAIDQLAEALTQSASTPLQAPDLRALRQDSPRLLPKIPDGE